MRAFLLAAGQGKRLLPYTKDIPKALLKVDEKEGLTIIEHQVMQLKRAGIDEIYVVIGYKGEKIKSILKENVCYIENPKFDITNSIYSVYLALPYMQDEVLILNADVLFHIRILELLLSFEEDAVISVDSSSVLDEETMKVAVNGNKVIDIRKDLEPGIAYGENLGLVKFRGKALEVLKLCVQDLISKGEVNRWFPAAFRSFIKLSPLYYVDVCGYPWIEIDFPEDLERARREVFPKIN